MSKAISRRDFLKVSGAVGAAGLLAACGGSDDTSDDTADPAPTEDTTPDDTADTETPEDTGEKFNLMTDITRIDPPELEGTTWNFAGGYLDGEEMDDDDATQTLSLYGGTLQFVFGEDGAMQIVQGGGSLDGADELFPPVEKEYQRVVEALKALE